MKKTINREYPLTESQLGIYLECINQNNAADYLIPLTFYFPCEKIDAKRLSAAFNAVVNAYSSFSTVIKVSAGQPVMCKKDSLPKIPVISIEESEIELHKKELFRPFLFDGELLWRGKILKTDSQVILALVIHHTVFDGSSVTVFNQALAKAYNGEVLSEEGTLFDFKNKEEEILNSELNREATAYFQRRFEGFEADSNLIPDKVPDKKQKKETKNYSAALSESEVKEFTQKLGVTENILFLSAFSYTLAKFNNQNEAVFSSVESGRFGGGFDNSIGMFVKSFPLRFTLDENITSSDFIKEVKKHYFDTLKHNHAKYSLLAKEYPGCADVEFIYQGEILKPVAVGGVLPKINVLDTYQPVSNFDVLVFKDNGKYNIWVGFEGNLYTFEMIDCFVDFYNTVLKEMISGKRLCDFNLVSKKSENFINNSNATEKEADYSLTVNNIFLKTAEKFSSRTAVSYGDKKLSYGELLRLCKNLAGYLIKKGFKAEDYISVLIPRNEFMAICALGVILSGSAYQPLDITYPIERLNFMVCDSKSRLLIADRSSANLISDFKGEILYTDEIESLPDYCEELPRVKPRDSGLLIYTSGTTGTPKGCIIENKNIVALYYNHKKLVELSENSKVATIASFGFDAGVMDIFTTLLCGGELLIIPDEIKLDIPKVEKFYTENGITNGFMTTQLGRMFLEKTKCKTLKHFVLGGEKLVPFTPPAWVKCHNDYGPSETLAYICGYVIKDNSIIQPIGTPSDNIKLYITDSFGRMLPPGAAGELCIAGPQVSRGYLNRPEKTAEAFCKNLFCQAQLFNRIYKTGDVVRMLPDGNYDFIGRRDGQVKIRGFRIELTEIEQIVREYKGIKNATVQAFDDENSEKFIAAYIVSDEKVDISDFNNYILEKKPPYMVPGVTMQVDFIPVNANGKVDKKKLPKPERRAEQITLPENETEQKIFNIVSGIVGAGALGIDTDLFFLGLSSIGSIKLCTSLAEEFDISVQMKDIRQNNTIRKLADFVGLISKNEIQKRNILPDYPLTKTQEGILAECIVKPESTFYNIPLLLKISNEINIDKLKTSVVKGVNAHDYIQTLLFAGSDGSIRQRRTTDFLFSEKDIETVYVKSVEEIKLSAVTPFKLTDSPLFLWRIYKTEKENYLFLDVHHIIADGTSIDILLSDIEKAYKGETPENENYNSFDLSLDEAAKRNSSLLFEAKSYYKNLLDGLDMNFLPCTDILPQSEKSDGVLVKFENLAQADKAKEFAEKNNISLNGLLVGAFGFVLAKYAGCDYSVFNTVYNGRSNSRAYSVFGMLVKTLPVVCNILKDTSISLCSDISAQLLDSYANDLYSFGEICKDFGVKNDIIFIFQGDSFNFDTFCGKPAEKIELSLSESKAPLAVQVIIENNKFKYVAEYNSDLFSEKLISTIITAFDKVVYSFVNNEKINEISLLTDEITAELDKINKTEFDYDVNKTITDCFAENAKAHPEKLCVVYKDKALTYGECFAYACKISEFLVKKGIKQGDVVSILIPRNENTVLSAHGVIMSGASYLGLDATYPKERLNFMLADSNTKLLIADRSLISLVSEFKGEILFTDEFDLLPETENNFDYSARLSPENIALTVYSSGTTGTPKGAQLLQKNIVCFFQSYSRDMELNENANVAMYASFGFDGGAMDVFCSPMSGATLYIIPDDIRLDLEKLEQFYIQNKITSGFMTTQVGTMFIRNTRCKTLKHFQVGGEKLIPTLPPSWIKFDNGYGPSETMCYVNKYNVTDTGNLQPIGKPNRNIKEYVIDKFGHRLPFGACGELCISGGQVGIGYLNRPEKTESAFVKNPFCDVAPYHRMYKTGDIVRQMNDGNYVFEGRRDGQVKIRGFRVELTEIEQVIREYPHIKNVAAMAFDNPSGGKYIAAYIVAEKSIDILSLNDFIASRKPDYMVPAVTMQIEEIPLNANGKTDKKHLPAPIFNIERKGAEPANETEEAICNIFEEVLGVEKVYADDDFFHIGGSSISAIQVVVKCNNMGYNIVFKNLFANSSPHRLSEFIHGKREEEAFAPETNDSDKYDYSSLKYNKVEYVDQISHKEIGDVLLTGSTGFLGSHLLKELLDNTSSKVICLVRSKGDIDAQTRFCMMMTYYFEDWYSLDKSKRVTVLDGELGDKEVMQKLSELHFDTIINSAANVKHFAPGDELLKDNFSGVENLISLAEKTNATLVQISSTSVSGEAVEGKIPQDFLFRECDLNIGQSLENKYIFSKYQAEQAVIDAISKKKIKGKIIRLGNLMARFDDSEFQINAGSNGFLKQFSGYKGLSMFPVDLMDKEIEFSPIDATAKAIVLLSGTPEQFTVFHAKNCNTIHYGYFINAMKNRGMDIRIVNNQVFEKKIKTALKNESGILELSSLIAYKDNVKEGEKEKIMHQIESDAAFTVKALYRLGFSWPLISEDYLKKMVETLVALGFFN